MRRYSAFAACVCDVYVCVCERCGLFREFCWTARITSFVLIIIIIIIIMIIIIIIIKITGENLCDYSSAHYMFIQQVFSC